MAAFIVNSFGLICDIIGAVMIFRFGLPEEVRKDGASFMRMQGDDEPMAKKYVLFKSWARVGISLLGLGFSLQFVASCMNYFG